MTEISHAIPAAILSADRQRSTLLEARPLEDNQDEDADNADFPDTASAVPHPRRPEAAPLHQRFRESGRMQEVARSGDLEPEAQDHSCLCSSNPRYSAL